MTEHLTAQEVDDFLAGHLTPAVLVELDHHLEVCAPCRARLDVLRPNLGRAFLNRLGTESAHLDFNELQAFADETLSAESEPRIKRHLAECAHCRTEAEDLLKFAAMLKTPLEQPHAKQAEKEPSWRSWVNALLPVMSPLQWAVAVAAVLIAVIALPRVLPSLQVARSSLVVLETIDDGGRRFTIDRSGQIGGWPGLPDDVREAVARAATTGAALPRALDIASGRRESGASHLIMGVAYWTNGLDDRANGELVLLEQQNPTSAVVRKIAANIAAR